MLHDDQCPTDSYLIYPDSKEKCFKLVIKKKEVNTDGGHRGKIYKIIEEEVDGKATFYLKTKTSPIQRCASLELAMVSIKKQVGLGENYVVWKRQQETESLIQGDESQQTDPHYG